MLITYDLSDDTVYEGAVMGIVSVSLPDEYIQQLDLIENTYGLRNRSDAMRQAIRLAEAEMKDHLNMSGHVEGVLVIVHADHDDTWMSRIQHRYEDQIRMQLHTHLSSGRCLDVMFVSSESEDMREILKEIRSTGKADYLKLVIS